MILGKYPCEAQPQPMSPCVGAYLGWHSSNVFEVLAIGPNMTIILLFGPLLPYEKGVT